jgi:ADP-dependent NAD(P)H-hydrate dehydratase
MSSPETVTPARLRDWPLPAPGSGKEARGQLVVLGGAVDTPGAVLLAGEAGLRAGAGKLAIATVAATASALSVAVPEAQVLGLEATDGHVALGAADTVVERVSQADVLLTGPGFGDPERTVDLLAAVLPRLDLPVVVDAVASAYLTQDPDGLRHLEGRAILTVNPSELAKTAHRDEDEIADRLLETTAELARRCGVVVLCGGERKYVATPDGDTWVVEGGGPGLGVSGSGDVQAGIVAGLLARGAEPAQAAVWGGYLHARSGERLAAAVGTVGYLARELPPQVPLVLRELS